jgi:hypothetical protein
MEAGCTSTVYLNITPMHRSLSAVRRTREDETSPGATRESKPDDRVFSETPADTARAFVMPWPTARNGTDLWTDQTLDGHDSLTRSFFAVKLNRFLGSDASVELMGRFSLFQGVCEGCQR